MLECTSNLEQNMHKTKAWERGGAGQEREANNQIDQERSPATKQ